MADASENQHVEALSKLEQLDSDFGARSQALLLRGEILTRLQRWDEAKAAFHEALEINQETPGPLLGLARVALASRDFESAVDFARASLGLLFFQPRAHYLVGLAHYRLGQFVDAEHALMICIRQAPLAAAAWRLLGELYRTVKHDELQAGFYFQQAKQARRRIAELRQATRDFSTPNGPSAILGENREMPILQLRPEALAGIPDSEIITLVSGLPRSGTSLMMQLLNAAGIPCFTDGHRTADDSNQNGYFEHDQVASLLTSRDRDWLSLANGKALKVVAPLLGALPLKISNPKSQITNFHYRVIFMERDMPEILESQRTMLARLGKDRPKGDVSRGYLQQVHAAKTWINDHGIPAMSVSYAELVHTPESILPQLANFLGVTQKLDAMRSTIDPTLHRARGQVPI